MSYLYLELPAAARRLTRIPRFGRLIAMMAGDPTRRARLSTEASILWELYSHTSSNRNETGLVDSGLDAIEAGRLGLNDKGFDEAAVRLFRENTINRKWQLNLAMDFWGAIAFQMFCGSNGDGKSPPLDRVIGDVDGFMNQVGNRFTATDDFHDRTGPYRNLRGRALDDTWINTDIECLRHLNSEGMRHLVLSDDRQQVLFCDITTQAFFAALWACRWATDDQLKMMRDWIPDPCTDSNENYREFWQMVIDMPIAAGLPRREAILSPLYDGTLRDQKDRPVRSSELICQSWELMKGTSAQETFLQEFQDILAEKQGQAKQEIARELLSDVTGTSQFLSLGLGRGGPQDNGVFLMGAADGEPDFGDDRPQHEVRLSPFRLHRYCVTNGQYELFDPRHVEMREFADKMTKASALDRHPVVNVSSWDGLAFGLWVGEQEIEGRRYRITLPTEAQWEYACRCGEQTPFTWGADRFGNRRDGNRIESEYCNFDGDHAWELGGSSKATAGPYLERTITVDGTGEKEVRVSANPWGFWQMHGNVWEWCQDWYDAAFYSTEDARQRDPENTSVATDRVLRGGCWFDGGMFCRSAGRDWDAPGDRSRFYSFRLAAVPCEPSEVRSQASEAEAQD